MVKPRYVYAILLNFLSHQISKVIWIISKCAMFLSVSSYLSLYDFEYIIINYVTNYRICWPDIIQYFWWQTPKITEIKNHWNHWICPPPPNLTQTCFRLIIGLIRLCGYLPQTNDVTILLFYWRILTKVGTSTSTYSTLSLAANWLLS